MSSRAFESYLALTKPKIVFLLDLTAVTAFLVSKPVIDPVRIIAVLVAGTLASGGAGALNNYVDRNLDREMRRTSQRPIPKGTITPARALVFGLALVAGALAISTVFLPLLASLFIFLGAAIYVLFYTKYLKP
ncbi:protoheme IX farnesyltransferase, partial [Candidatus Bathyarchaeota archaeon]